jgi:uncharacterized protein YndB with AHSA1/START domain
MTGIEGAVVRRSVTVPIAQDVAFAVFTEQIGDFKPPEHNLLSVPILETVLEPREGGAIIDRGSDGSECRWARVLIFEPPARLVFSWDIGPTWQIEDDPANTSEVEVRFVAEGSSATRVELEHRYLDRHGPGWESVRDGVAGEQGWPLYLERYAAIATGRPSDGAAHGDGRGPPTRGRGVRLRDRPQPFS